MIPIRRMMLVDIDQPTSDIYRAACSSTPYKVFSAVALKKV